MSFDEFSDVALGYYDAVSKRDRKKFESYLNDDLSFTAILSNEGLLTDVGTFRNSQDFWFKGTSGSFTVKPHGVWLGDGVGHFSVIADYRNQNGNGTEFAKVIYISSVFKKISQQWFLVHIQNTVLETR
jgi:hypothetical protein